MRSIVNSCAALAAAALLAACAAQSEPAVTVTQDFRNTAVEAAAPTLSDEQLAERYAQVAESASEGNVVVFGLEDGLPPAPEPVPMPPEDAGPPMLQPVAMPADAGGAPSMNDPNVTVYPFPEDSLFIPAPIAREEPPALRPPVKARPPMPSPFRESEAVGEFSARIYFNHGQTVLDPGDEATLRDFAAAHRSATGVIRVEGYASARAEGRSDTDKRIANLKISMDRAMNVSRALIRQGVPAPSIATIAYGDARPAVPGNGRDTEAASRRVEIHAGPAR